MLPCPFQDMIMDKNTRFVKLPSIVDVDLLDVREDIIRPLKGKVSIQKIRKRDGVIYHLEPKDVI
jgi:hypothetical protein